MRNRWTRLDSDSYADKVRSVAERFNAIQSLSRRLEQSALSRRSRQSFHQQSNERRKTSKRPADADTRAKNQDGTRPEDQLHDREGPSHSPKLRKHIHPCVCDISPVKLRQIDQMVESRRVSRAELQRRLERVHEFLRSRTDHTKRRDEADAVKQRVRAAKMRSEIERKARIEAGAKDAESRLGSRQTGTRRPRRQDDSLFKPGDDFDDLDESPPLKEAGRSKKPGKPAASGAAGRSKKRARQSRQSPKSTESRPSKAPPKTTKLSREKSKRRSTSSPKRSPAQSKPKRGRRESRDQEDRGGRQGRGRRGGKREDRKEEQDRGERQDRKGRVGPGGRQERQQSDKSGGQLTPRQQREMDREKRQQQRATRQAARTPSVDKKIQKVVIRKVRRQPAPQRESYSTLEPRERIDWRKTPSFEVRETKTSRLRKLESGYCESRSQSRLVLVEKQFRSLTPERVRELIRRPPPSQARPTRTWSLRLQMAKKLDLTPKIKYRRPSFEAGYNLMLKYRPWPDPVNWKIKAGTSLSVHTRSTKGGKATTTDIRVDVKPTTRNVRYGPSTSATQPIGTPPYGTTSFAPDVKMTTGRTRAGTTSPTVGTMTAKSSIGFTQGTGAPTTKSPTDTMRLTSGTKPTIESPTASELTQSTKSPTTKSPTASTTSLTQSTKSSMTKSPMQSTTNMTSGTPTQSTKPTEGTKSTSPTPSTTSRTQSTKATTKNSIHGTSSSTSTTKPTTKDPAVK